MLAKLISSQMGGHTVIEFQSKEDILRIGTFCLQIPNQITSLKKDESFEIPDEFMRDELNLSDENPITWYSDTREELKIIYPDKVNEHFLSFMDAIAKFCQYDRKRIMQERQEWYENTYMN